MSIIMVVVVGLLAVGLGGFASPTADQADVARGTPGEEGPPGGGSDGTLISTNSDGTGNYQFPDGSVWTLLPGGQWVPGPGDEGLEGTIMIRSKEATVPPLDDSENYVFARYSVSCEPGETVIGGGFKAEGASWISSSYPKGNAWVNVLTSDNYYFNARGTVYAVCLR